MIKAFFTLKTPANANHDSSEARGRFAVCLRKGNNPLNTTIKADARFLRRIFLGLVAATVISGCMAALTTVQAKATDGGNSCLVFCQ